MKAPRTLKKINLKRKSINSKSYLHKLSESEVDIYQLKSWWRQLVFYSLKYVMMHCSALWIYLKTFFLVSIISCQQRNMREEISKKTSQSAWWTLKTFSFFTKKNNEQRKKKSFQTRLERFDTLPSSAEMDPIWWDFYLMNQLGMKIWRSEHEIKSWNARRYRPAVYGIIWTFLWSIEIVCAFGSLRSNHCRIMV